MKKNLNDYALAVLRIGISAMMIAAHGFDKFKALFESPSGFPDPLGIGGIPTLIIAVFGEFIGPLLVIVGFKTRIATIPTIITMAGAIFVVHASDPLATKEKAILYFVGFIAIAIAGAGKYSIDKK